VRDIGLVGLGLDPDLGYAAEVLRVVAVAALTGMTDLQQELALLRKLEDVGVLFTVTADPDIALVIDMDAVIGLRPFISRPGTTPRSHKVALRVEDQHRWSRAAALGNRGT